MTKEKKRIALAVCLLAFLVGISAMLYPIISSLYSEKVRSEIRTEYEEVLETTDKTEIALAFSAAHKFNQQLFRGEINHLDPKNNGYFDLLNLANNGIMAYVEIPKINITLPVYHGTGDEALTTGAGHMPQSSLPVGGENTHAVISAHTGMASNPMFSDLELLEKGDIFKICVLGETMYYQVYNVKTVLPEDISFVQIQRGKDYCTLVTCTPYGVNTHRLLVQGERIDAPTAASETSPASSEIADTSSIWLSQYQRSVITGLCIAAGVLCFLGLVFFIRFILQKRKRDNNEE